MTESDVIDGQYALSIDGLSLGPIDILTKDSLIIDQRHVDGFQYVFLASE